MGEVKADNMYEFANFLRKAYLRQKDRRVGLEEMVEHIERWVGEGRLELKIVDGRILAFAFKEGWQDG